MKCFSYVIVRDYGFAPNPFGNYCTLATCKPYIRERASVGDLVIGTGSKKYKHQNKLIYAMVVSEKLNFNEYWQDKRFYGKKPVLNGSLKQTYGDNIYYSENDTWIQMNSHHSRSDGSPNWDNMNRDLKSKYVLISKQYWYFGGQPIDLPREFEELCVNKRGYKNNFPQEIVTQFFQWLNDHYDTGYYASPHLFKNFVRYHGKY